jgi:uncharacterized protein YbaR (Trm112 family)
MSDSRRGKKKKPLSREKYERENPTVSFRLDRKTYERLREHLSGREFSFADFVKDHLGQEDSTIAARAEALAARQAGDFDDRQRCLEGLVNDILLKRDVEDDIYCPMCPTPLVVCHARLIEFDLDPTPILACPECKFFLNAYYRIDPDTIEWPQDEED